jgi:dipeptide/tripeptide permease
MQEQGIPQQQIDDLIAVCLKERDTEIRKRGVVETAVGAVILAVSASILVGMVLTGIGVKGVFVMCGVGAILGFIRLVRGLSWLFGGGKMRGSLSEMGNDGLP